MANGISSIASARTLNAAKNSEQVTKPDLAAVPANRGGSLPPKGNALPARVADFARINEAVNRINEVVQSVQRDLSFNLDEDSGRTVIRVVNSENGELIRQIPSEQVLAIANHLRDYQEEAISGGEIGQGLLFSDSS
jgi:flagellar protein FlaG